MDGKIKYIAGTAYRDKTITLIKHEFTELEETVYSIPGDKSGMFSNLKNIVNNKYSVYVPIGTNTQITTLDNLRGFDKLYGYYKSWLKTKVLISGVQDCATIYSLGICVGEAATFRAGVSNFYLANLVRKDYPKQ